jgi:hypothetical protein
MTVFRTIVTKVPPTPLGLLPESWAIEHWCRTCRHRVAPQELLRHAQDHDHDNLGEEGSTS